MGIKGELAPGSTAPHREPHSLPSSGSALRTTARGTMKVLAATLATLLLLATCSPAEGHLDGIPSTCCFSYRRQRVPASRISSVFVTSSACTHPGVIVVTTKGKQLCADPRVAWVKELLKHFQSLKN